MKLILASQSPRRRELLLAAGIPHDVRAANVDESVLPGESPVDYVRRVAESKAAAVWAGCDEMVLAADTTVVCAGEILGKPKDINDAARMLRLLSGRRHEVITGFCIRRFSTKQGNIAEVGHEATSVWFTPISEEEITAYVASGEPMDKAGAYAIQGIASRYAERIEGSYSNVVGLPVAAVWQILQKPRSSLS